MNGCTMPLEKLYPPITYPVSRGTAKISPLLRWDHSVTFFVSKFEMHKTPESGERRVKINLADEEFAYIAGHTIDGNSSGFVLTQIIYITHFSGRCLFPATGYLELVWVTFAMMKGSEYELMNVEFEDIQFLRATALQADMDVELTVMIHYGKGSFEVSEGSTSIVTGFVREVEHKDATLTELPPLDNSTYPMLNRQDFYKELRLRGYQYKDEFQSVSEARSDGLYGKIHWNRNWVSFMDCILQTMILSKDTRSLMLPTRIQKIRIFPMEHIKRGNIQRNETHDIEVYMNTELNIVQAGGVEIIGMVTNAVSRRKAAGELILESYRFVPHNPPPLCNHLDALRICLQLLVENNPSLSSFKVLEVQSKERSDQLVTTLDQLFGEIPVITSKMTLLTDQNVDLPNVSIENNALSGHTKCHLIVLSDFSLIESCGESLVDEGFLIVRHPLGYKQTEGIRFNLIANISTEAENIVLLRQKPSINENERRVIDISNSKNTFAWLDEVKDSVKVQPLLLVAQHDRFSGIIGLVNCIRREPETKDVACIFIDDDNAPPFDLNNPFYANQLSLHLAVNVYRQVRSGPR